MNWCSYTELELCLQLFLYGVQNSDTKGRSFAVERPAMFIRGVLDLTFTRSSSASRPAQNKGTQIFVEIKKLLLYRYYVDVTAFLFCFFYFFP